MKAKARLFFFVYFVGYTSETAPGALYWKLERYNKVVAGTVATIFSSVAADRAANSERFLAATTGKITSLTINNAGNFRKNLSRKTGNPPNNGNKHDAHHGLPQKVNQLKFNEYFKSRNIDIHDAVHGGNFQIIEVKHLLSIKTGRHILRISLTQLDKMYLISAKYWQKNMVIF